jgi:hypothetical protein
LLRLPVEITRGTCLYLSTSLRGLRLGVLSETENAVLMDVQCLSVSVLLVSQVLEVSQISDSSDYLFHFSTVKCWRMRIVVSVVQNPSE